jgi:hypothetical protein
VGGTPACDEEDSDTWVFRGSAQPNPSFLYEYPTALEGLIAVEVDAHQLLTVHGDAIRAITTKVAEAATSVQCPLLYLQSPAQLPHRDPPPDDPSIDAAEWWGPSSSLAVRFALSIGRCSSADRSDVAGSLAKFCQERGLGLWLRDSRPGHRSGNWVEIVERRPEEVESYLSRFIVNGQGRQTIQITCPLTFVGPARVGSTRAILRMLGDFHPVPIAAISVASLDDLAFIHLQLALPMNDGDDYKQMCKRLSGWSATSQGCLVANGFPSLRNELGLGQNNLYTPQLPGDVMERAHDFQMFAGPIVTAVDEPAVAGRPLWFSWDVERSTDGMTVPLSALALALGDVGLHALTGPTAGTTASGTNIEYLLCRDTGNATLRAKGKLRVPDELWKALSPDRTPQAAAVMLAKSLEAAWLLRAGQQQNAFAELTVAWREHWLGH